MPSNLALCVAELAELYADSPKEIFKLREESFIAMEL